MIFNRHNDELLRAAFNAWSAGADLRARRERQKRFTYGDQWCDLVTDPDNRRVREDVEIVRSGKRVLTNNLIRQLVKTIVGRFRMLAQETGAYDTKAEWVKRNQLAELDSRMLEEFLISGMAVQRVVREKRMQGEGVWVDNVDPRRLFVSNLHDPRGFDIDMIGMIHDMTMPEVMKRFGRRNAKRMGELRRIFESSTGRNAYPAEGVLGLETACGDFFTAPDGRCRVIEVWTVDFSERHSRGSEGQGTVDIVMSWHCRWLAPDGTELESMRSPYAHGEHPFVIKFYPLTDGEVHSFVEDVIDQQKYINRLIVMIDHIMASSAKGVLLFPVDQLPPDVTWDHVVRSWTHSDGVIPITGQGQQLPQQIVTPTANSGAYQLLSLQMKLFEEISGVGDALLGRNMPGNGGVKLYESQIHNATVALTDLLDAFSTFTAGRNAKAQSL